MPQFEIVTLEQHRCVYVATADTAEEAQAQFENGDLTDTAFDEAIDVEVTEVRPTEEDEEETNGR